MRYTAWAEIDLSALSHNLRQVTRLCPRSRVVAMIKADGYGHGLVPVAQTLAKEADKLGVARLVEALALREAGVTAPILLMGTFLDQTELELCAARDIAVTLHEPSLIRLIQDCAPVQPLEVWLKLDTGMNRLGLSAADFQVAYRTLKDAPNVGLLRAMTHFSSADEPDNSATRTQIEALERETGALQPIETSLANSAGLIAWPQSRADWVRPGIMLYGDNPVHPSHPLELCPVMTLKSRVLAIRELSAGQKVGYNRTWAADSISKIAAIGIGYGDGYPRQLPNGTPVLINGEELPLAGRISMDICSVDVTRAATPVAVGDEVTLWGEGLHPAGIAARAGTISYHLFTGVTARVPRCYTGE